MDVHHQYGRGWYNCEVAQELLMICEVAQELTKPVHHQFIIMFLNILT